MGNRGRTNARLVRERRTLESLNQHPHKSSVHRIAVEGATENFAKGRRHFPEVAKNDRQGAEDVNAHHEGDHFVRHFGDALDASKNDGRHNHGHDDPENPAVAVEHGGFTSCDGDELACGLVDLNHVATAKGTANACNGEQRGQHGTKAFLVLLGQSVTQVVHRST